TSTALTTPYAPSLHDALPICLVERERPDAVVVFTVPMAHFRGIPTALRDRFGIPVCFYDGDVPMSLPEFGGMDSSFNYYHGADPDRKSTRLNSSHVKISYAVF